MSIDQQLARELAAMDADGTRKRIPVLSSPQGPVVRLEGRGEVLCLCSNDYLGLAADSRVVAAAADGLERYGAGTASVLRHGTGRRRPQWRGLGREGHAGGPSGGAPGGNRTRSAFRATTASSA